MPSKRDWRTPVASGGKPLRYLDIALGYLSRNPRYRAQYERARRDVRRGRISAGTATAALVRRWGVSLAVAVEGREGARAIAHPARSPANILLIAPPDLFPARPVELDALGNVHTGIMLDAAMHIAVPDPQGGLDLWLFAPPDMPMAIMLPLNDDLNARFTEAERLRRLLRGVTAGPSSLIVPPSRQTYLLTLLRMLDGRRADVRPRELAAMLIDPRVRDYGAAEWSDSAERRQLGRWIAAASELVGGGYLRLLRGA